MMIIKIGYYSILKITINVMEQQSIMNELKQSFDQILRHLHYYSFT